MGAEHAILRDWWMVVVQNTEVWLGGKSSMLITTPAMGVKPEESAMPRGICPAIRDARASLVSQMVKNPPANAGDAGLIPGSGRPPREGNGNPLQYSCLESPRDRGAWWATVLGVAKKLDT